MRRTRARWMLLLVLCLPLIAAAQAQEKKLSLDLYLEWEEVSDPQISPDGRHIVFTRRWVDKLNDKWESALWLMNADGSHQRFLVKGSSLRWSPDGTRIAYLAEGEPKGTQIFVRWMDAEAGVTQITRLEKTPASLVWSPDSQSIAFTMIVPPKKESWAIGMPKRPEDAKWTPEPRIVERLVYRLDRVGFLDEGYRHIFLVPANGGTPRQITGGDYNHGGGQFGENDGLSWTPDGREILFSSLREPDWEYRWREAEIYAVNVPDGSVRQLTHRKGPKQNPVVSPDGKQVAFTGYEYTDDTYVDSKLYVMGIDGSNPRVLTPSFDRTPQHLTWAPDGSGIYFTADDRGARNLHFASPGGTTRQITQGNHVLAVTHINRNGQAVGTLSSYQ